ncbi:MAG: hypothetical protein ABSD64_07585 [Terriglobales bacterium]|jgi:hypothetical protein
MSKSRLFQVVVLVAIVALFACSQMAMAATKPHFQIKVIPKTHSGVNPMVAEPPTVGLYGVAQWFGYTSYLVTSGTDLWPCFGNTATPDPNCADIISGGVVLGAPSLSWPLAACDANSTVNAYDYCGQTETWYEDWSNDSTDELTYLLVATQVQGSATVTLADSGIVDFGPNVYGAACGGTCPPAADVIIYGDQDFGTQGLTGVNNGNCEAPYAYPLNSAAFPVADGVYVVPANKTCKNPLAGLVTLTATTEVGAPVYTKSTKASVCATSDSGVPPCWTVKWTKKYSVAQKWVIDLY